jgi:hypothetical protein
MFVSVIDLQIGQGDADTLLSRIESDLVPIYQDAEGFVAYFGVKQSDTSVETIRIFEDEESIQAAVEATKEKTDQIIQDLNLTPSEHASADATIAVIAGKTATRSKYRALKS